MIQTRRERLREAAYKEILETAWKQVAELGPSALSLRAIAREMGLTAPALYRYYPTRDDLVTAMISEAFDSFSRRLEQARDVQPENDHAGRLRSVCRAYFDWAVASPWRYSLLFGAPVPGYKLGEAAYPSARRSFLVLQGILGEALSAGQVTMPDLESLPDGLWSRYHLLEGYGMPYTPAATHLALVAWSAIHGITSLFLYGYLNSFLGDQVSEFVNVEVDHLIANLGFTSPQSSLE